MPTSEDSPTEQVRKLKAMLAQNEKTAKEMHELIAEMEAKAKDSKEKKRGND
jgi:hypothetical protein